MTIEKVGLRIQKKTFRNGKISDSKSLFFQSILRPTKVLQAIIHDMESAGAVTLEHFIETIESESPSKENLPRDGTVHEMASNAFLFLEQLQAHSGVGGGMIAAKENDGISSPAQCKRAFSNYILRVLKAMKNNLQAKAKLYEESKALRALFLMNNFNFIIQRNMVIQEICTRSGSNRVRETQSFSTKTDQLIVLRLKIFDVKRFRKPIYQISILFTGKSLFKSCSLELKLSFLSEHMISFKSSDKFFRYPFRHYL